jgi:cyclophilin family peptidyl-prolyl cis-trans isomerase
LKTILYAAALCTLVACTQTSTTESVTQKSEPATTEVASTETLTPMASAAAPDPDASADPAKKTTAKKATKQEKKPMDYSKTIAEIHTSSGEIDVRFFPDKAPNHVKNFIDLAQSGFYNGIKFHRVIPGFMIQGGDPNTKSGAPNSWGTGGSPNKLKAEFNDIKHTRGILSAARTSDPNSASSQFFVMVATAPSLDNQYSVFGQVVKGMEVADKIVNAARDANDRPNNPTSIERIVIREAKPGEIPAAK